MSDPLLTVTGVEAGFGANVVLHGVDLTVEQGSSVGLFGLNGAGKSVTMKVIAGLVAAREGSVTLAGRDITTVSPEERVALGMAYTPQARQLFPKLTVEQNLRLGGYLLRRKSKARYASVVGGIYERFPRLYERRGQLAGSMSGGEQAMLTIGRALASGPRLLLIDEPSAGLAPAVIQDVLVMLQGLRADGMTLVLVEQNISFGFRLVDRAAILQRGQVVYEGDVATLDTAKVAKLLGVGRLLGSHLERAVGKRPRAARAGGSKRAAPNSSRGQEGARAKPVPQAADGE
jgi:branched-chain amino acid transport system ATP-binding protein